MLRSNHFIVLFFLTFFSVPLIAQKVSVHVFINDRKAKEASDTIFYDFNRKLKWDDFLGKPEPGAPWGAVTASGFSYGSSISEDDGNMDIEVGIFTFFIKSESWKKPGINSAYHLEHEQHHFDITRLSAEKLMEEIKKAHFTIENVSQLLNTIFDKVNDYNTSMQHQYDLETNNSINVQKQTEWNQKINTEINKIKNEK
ncbi:MAG TPA: hypothetical protein VIJ75_17320 [Hanamia sp.]